MKKNMIAIVAAVALVLLAVPTIAFANGMQQTWCSVGGSGSLAHHAMRSASAADAVDRVGAAINTVRGEYVDRNNDGVCDNYVTGRADCSGYVDQDGDGICDACENGQSACPGFVDADADGVCDSYSSNAHYGCGSGCAYVDVDNDGVCDNYGAGNGSGCGAGRGQGNGGGQHGCMRR